MRIKEVAERAALTERAVRLYEKEGLIAPRTTYMGGRAFREYDDGDVERLKTIRILRRALYTVEEIKAMLDDPSRLATVSAAHDSRVRREFSELTELLKRMEGADAVAAASADEYAHALFSDEGEDAASADAPDPEPYREVYEKYFSENTKWERGYEARLRIRGAARAAGRFFSRRAVKIAVVCAVVAFVIVMIPRVETVSYTYKGGEVGAGAEAEFKVEGRYVRRLFFAPRFEGVIETEKIGNVSAPEVPGRFSFSCRFREGKDVGARLFDVRGVDGTYAVGAFDGEPMESLVLIVYGDDGRRCFYLSRTDDGAAAESLAGEVLEFFPG